MSGFVKRKRLELCEIIVEVLGSALLLVLGRLIEWLLGRFLMIRSLAVNCLRWLQLLNFLELLRHSVAIVGLVRILLLVVDLAVEPDGNS